MVSQNSSSYNNVYRFSGKELDEETGLSYFGARYYNPKWSIWLSVDPLAEKFPDRSPYNYTMNNPINLIDPDGRAPEPPKNGISQFIDNTGVYFWRADKKAYEQYKYTDSSREHYSFSGYYSVNSNSKAVGKSVSIDNNAPATITTDGFKVWGFDGDAIAGSGNMKGDRGSGSIQADLPGDVGMLYEFGQLLGDGIDWLFGNDKPTSTNTQSSTTTVPTVESTESVQYRETTGKSSKYGNMNLPDFKVKDTVVPESKASEVYKTLEKKFQDDWQKQVKKDN